MKRKTKRATTAWLPVQSPSPDTSTERVQVWLRNVADFAHGYGILDYFSEEFRELWGLLCECDPTRGDYLTPAETVRLFDILTDMLPCTCTFYRREQCPWHYDRAEWRPSRRRRE